MSKKRVLGSISLLLFSAAVVCYVLYLSADVYVDEQGVLHEPFGLIPLGWLFFLGGIVAGTAFLVFRSKGKQAK